MDKPRVLIVDDDDDTRMQMKWALNSRYDLSLAEDRPSALEILQKEKPRAVTLDLGLPPFPGDTREGFITLENMLQLDPFLKIIVVTGQGEKENGIKAIGQGAYDVFAKPVNIDDLKVVLDRALYIQELEREGRETPGGTDVISFEGIVGNSSQIQVVFGRIQKVSGTDASVLIVGESGTGKELVARAIHRRSTRRTGPFVTINCGAIPENLLESELFGHEKGSFTGAHIQRHGRIEAAQGGTLFLDEIGDLSVPLQVKLLRFIQEHEIERVGGRSSIRVDARVLAATSVDLRKAMSEGRFREDLYYRLGVVVISVPPLRDRQGDIQLLAQAFLQKQASPQRKPLMLTAKAIKAMDSYQWPGNVRELENRIQRASIMAESGRITPEDLEISRVEQRGNGLEKARRELERRMIEAALARNKGNLTQVAVELEISRPTLYELIARLAIPR